MHDALWSDRELRSFLSSLRGRGLLSGEPDDLERARFVDQAALRVVPRVQARLIAEVGAPLDPDGIAAIAFEVLEDETWGKHHTWMMVTTDPWGHLSGLVADRIRSSYRATAGRRDRKALRGIAEASDRVALPAAADPNDTDEGLSLTE
ncbi:tellurite resistance TerB family protein [Microbacterium fluvii]|uniref:Tellurite resistance TerB family protein n=1 Tax=Microbacterium fluvii TaxID=415215 RepID=A0ABW2HGB3_9MICO|nr:tellurite resistance TerB family protein [Microbacterium fluvii]MCU4673187.1 tellurite resistance TerB family protein [Microbacterium fluvii]